MSKFIKSAKTKAGRIQLAYSFEWELGAELGADPAPVINLVALRREMEQIKQEIAKLHRE